MTLVAALAALALILALGGFPWRWHGESTRGEALVRAYLCGGLALHLALELIGAIGLRWSIAPLLACAATAAVAARRVLSTPGPFPESVGATFGDAVALAVCATVAVYTLRLQTVTPDFVFHWGLKARRFAEVGGFDSDFLTLNSAFRYHPQYPCLGIDFAALPGILTGGDSIVAALVPSLAALALMFVIARDLLARTGADGLTRGALLSIWGLAIGRFAIGHRIGGQSDLLLAFAVLAAVPALLDPERPTATREIALSAAFAAIAKVEGLAYALVILCIYAAAGLFRAPGSLPSPGRWLKRTVLPAAAIALVAAPWLWRTVRLGLGDGGLTGGYRWERMHAALVAAFQWQVRFQSPEWSVWPIVALVGIAVLLVGARTRRVGALALGILGVNFAAYSGGNPEVATWVTMSFPRLLFHWVPAVLLVLAVRFAETMAARNPRLARPTARFE